MNKNHGILQIIGGIVISFFSYLLSYGIKIHLSDYKSLKNSIRSSLTEPLTNYNTFDFIMNVPALVLILGLTIGLLFIIEGISNNKKEKRKSN